MQSAILIYSLNQYSYLWYYFKYLCRLPGWNRPTRSQYWAILVSVKLHRKCNHQRPLWPPDESLLAWSYETCAAARGRKKQLSHTQLTLSLLKPSLSFYSARTKHGVQRALASRWTLGCYHRFKNPPRFVLRWSRSDMKGLNLWMRFLTKANV